MSALKKIYAAMCKAEEGLVSICLISTTGLVFISAMFRFLGTPVNWAMDISLLLFAWGSLLGADIGIRKNRIINVDFLTSKFPMKIQRYLAILWSIVIIALLVMLIAYGVPLCFENAKRQFQNITISYSVVTLSLPVSALLMIFSMIGRLKLQIKDYPASLVKEESTDVV